MRSPISDSFIPYGRQVISDDDIKSVVSALSSPLITQGQFTPDFEEKCADFVTAKYGVAVNSATSALHLACLALGLGPGDSLWTSPITFVASANCGLYCGASIDFIDICAGTGLIDVNKLEAKLDAAAKAGRLPKIVIPVHLAGTSCDMESIWRLSNIYGFSIIEDASHAFGGLYQNEPVGCCRFSDISVFSFHPVKMITTGEGGLATTNSFDLAQKMRAMRSHGITKDPSDFTFPSRGPWAYEQQELGFNYRMTDFQAALGISQLTRLSAYVRERNQIRNQYNQYLSSLPVKLLEVPEDVISSVHLLVIRLISGDPVEHLQLFKTFRESGIGVQVHYSPVHLQPYYRKLGFEVGDFPNAEFYEQNAISIPVFPGMTNDQFERVINVITSFFTA